MKFLKFLNEKEDLLKKKVNKVLQKGFDKFVNLLSKYNFNVSHKQLAEILTSVYMKEEFLSFVPYSDLSETLLLCHIWPDGKIQIDITSKLVDKVKELKTKSFENSELFQQLTKSIAKEYSKLKEIKRNHELVQFIPNGPIDSYLIKNIKQLAYDTAIELKLLGSSKIQFLYDIIFSDNQNVLKLFNKELKKQLEANKHLDLYTEINQN